MSVNLLTVWFSSSTCLLVLCLVVPSLTQRKQLTPPTIISGLFLLSVLLVFAYTFGVFCLPGGILILSLPNGPLGL